MSIPRRFTAGVTNVSGGTNTGMLGMPDPSLYHTFFDDFDTYTAGQWTVTETNAAATEALTDANGGRLLITNTAADDDLVALNKVGESFVATSGKKMWFKSLFRVSDATQSDLVMGLQITDTTPLAVSDGIYFQKDDGDTNIDFYVTGSSSSSSLAGIGTLANATDITLGFYYDGVSKVYAYVNDIEVGSVGITNLPSTELTISFAIQNGEAVAKTMTVDYILAVRER